MSARYPHRDDVQVDVPVLAGNARISGRKDLVDSFLALTGLGETPPVERPPTDSTDHTSQAPPRLAPDGREHRDGEPPEQNMEGMRPL